MGRIRRDCDPCRNDWKEKINQLWNNYQSVVKSITLNGSRKTPDGQGNVDLGTIETEVEWGDIGGTLADQTDLANALADKADSSSLATVATTGDYDDLTDKPDLSAKLDAPSTAGTAGQVLKLNSDLEPVWANESGGGGSVDWGDIGGTLADQTDLSNALAGKLSNNTSQSGSIAVGPNADTNYAHATAYGESASVNSEYSIAIGPHSYISSYSQGSIAIGLYAQLPSPSTSYAIQLGRGTNQKPQSFKVGFSSNNYELLDGTTGKIPNDRLNLSDIMPTSVANTSVTIWASDATYADYPYRAAIPITGVTTNDIAEVIFGLSEAISGDYAPICETYNGGVYIYSKSSTSITVPTIIVNRTVSA